MVEVASAGSTTRREHIPTVARPWVDIIVDNYNYAPFLGDAVDSALAQTYERVRVIVVDDGSTDASREVIASYGDRIVPVLKENGGQASCFNAGLERATGEIVLFLDADDVLVPEAVEHVVEAFEATPGTARVHYRLAVVDESGAPTGEIKPAPHIALPSGDLRAATLRFPFDLARPATSGNAYSARVVRAISPIEDCGDRVGADWYLVCLSPLLGPVAAIDEPLGLYRVHGANLHERASTVIDLDQVRATIRYSARTRRHLEELARRLDLPWDGRDAAMSEVADRAISRRLDPAGHPIAGDTPLRLLRLGIRAAGRRYDVRLPFKAAFVAWLVCLTLAPRRLARPLAEIFVYPGRRESLNVWLKRMSLR